MDHYEISARFFKLEQQIDNLEKYVIDTTSKILAEISILTANMNVGKRTFPVSSFEELGQLESDAQANPEAFIISFKNIIGNKGIKTGLKRLLSEDLLFKMNYSGKMGQVGLVKYNNFTDVLYESLKTDNYSLDQYKLDLRSAFTKAKNKVYKNTYDKKKKTNIQENTYDKKGKTNFQENVCGRKFPISSFEELGQLDSDAQANPEAFKISFKNIIGNEGIIAGLRKLLSDDLLFKMNYSGKMGQVGLVKYYNFTNVLYESLKNENYSLQQYKCDLRSAILKAKNKVYKNNFNKKRKTNSQE
ncbi:uncharacterized protein LOC108099017 isoform X2 [Drosophila ficusphila]|uniref:uncharacterized protein LOC108099017 isoform X2 n=1 Tax=Drosophila ficusphila TaxID=30025 RepID=UPI0007E862AA|nr:uncharacterized protein LOC108099017 isoform X2 [Drosophila ficusphila]